MNNDQCRCEYIHASVSERLLSVFSQFSVFLRVIIPVFFLLSLNTSRASVAPGETPAAAPPSVSLLRPGVNNSTPDNKAPQAVMNEADSGVAGAGKKGLTFFPMQIEYSAQENTGGVVVNVVNPTPATYLLQGTVRAFVPDTGRAAENSKEASPPFVILPPLRRLDGEGRVALRIRQVGGALPTDRETAVIVSVRAIPSQEKKEGDSSSGADSRVLIALRMNMRLFWRPVGLASPDAKKIASSLTFTRKGNTLEVSNPTPWFVHFSTLRAGGMELPEAARGAWISPMSSHTFLFDKPVTGPLTWTLSGDKNEHQTP